MGDRIRIRLFGPVQIIQGGQPVAPVKSLKALALLAYLIAQKSAVSRAQLVALFWPELPEARGRANLSWVASYLGKLLPDSLETSRHSLQWNSEAAYWVDLLAFEGCIEEGATTALQEAVDLYRGELLEGFFLDDCPEFETWLLIERERWQRQAAGALQSLSEHYAGLGTASRAIRLSLQLLHLEPWREEIHRRVMSWMAHDGQYTAALRQFEQCRQTLEEELGLSPAPETQRLYRRIRAARKLPRPGPSLPSPQTPFVGREEELAELQRLLHIPTCNLVTLTGLGGAGKTRLALEVAAHLPHAFLEGIAFIPLLDLPSAGFLAAAIAQKLDFPLHGSQPPMEQLLDYLQTKEMLLILDEFEHLIPEPGSAGAKGSEGLRLIRGILGRAPAVKLLVTSRQRLNLQEEWVVPLGGLPVRDARRESDAVKLFHQRAQQAGHDFSATGEEKASVTRICELVAGLPLGIELAAALITHHSPAEIAGKLESDLLSLTSPLSNVPERHRSLQAMFAHSWELLSPAEQRAFRQLAVFRGGFSRDAAVRATGIADHHLRALADKSLLVSTSSGRLEMHPLVQRFAQRKLSGHPSEAARIYRQHAGYYLEFTRAREEHLKGSRVQEALQEIQGDIENIRAGWGWAVSHGETALLEQALESLFRYFENRSLFHEGEHLFRMALDELAFQVGADGPPPYLLLRTKLRARRAFFAHRLGGSVQAGETLQRCLEELRQLRPPPQREVAFVYRCLADVEAFQGEFEASVRHAQSALAVYEQVEDTYGMAIMLNIIGAALWEGGNYPQAKTSLEGSLKLYRSLGNRGGEAAVTHNLGALSDLMGETSAARAYFERSLENHRSRRGEGLTLTSMGFISIRLGDFPAARARLEEAVHICQEIGDRRNEGIALSNLCLLHCCLGEHRTALDYGRQALEIARDLGDVRYQGYALARLGNALLSLGRTEEARRHYQQALELRNSIGQKQLAVETLAALGNVALQQGDLRQAKAHVEEVLAYLDRHPPEGMDDPARVYLICARVLRACDDPRAEELRQQGEAL